MLTEKPEHMTDEEWSAFNDDEMGEAPSLKYQDSAEVKLDDDNATIDPVQTVESEKQPDPVNLDDIEVPDITGADSKLEKLTSEYTIAKNELSDLQQKWDDGELTEAEYNIETSVLERKMARLEGKIEAAEEQAEDEAAKIERYQKQAEQVWNQEKDKFFALPENQKFLQKRSMFNALDGFVKELLEQPHLTPKDLGNVLREARQKYVEDFGEFYQGARQQHEPKPQPTVKPQPSKVEPPKTLAHMPVAEPNNVLDGRFAVLDNIKDPEQLEKAIARMSPSDRDAYLRGAA